MKSLLSRSRLVLPMETIVLAGIFSTRKPACNMLEAPKTTVKKYFFLAGLALTCSNCLADILIPTSILTPKVGTTDYYAIEMKRIPDLHDLSEEYFVENLGIPERYGREWQIGALRHLHRISQLTTIHARLSFYVNYVHSYEQTLKKLVRRFKNHERIAKIRNTIELNKKKEIRSNHWLDTTGLIYLFQHKLDLGIGAIREVYPNPKTGNTIGEKIAGVHSPPIVNSGNERMDLTDALLGTNVPIFAKNNELKVIREKREIKSAFGAPITKSSFALLMSAVKASDFFGPRQSKDDILRGLNQIYLPHYLLAHARPEATQYFARMGFSLLANGVEELDDYCQLGQTVEEFKKNCYDYLELSNNATAEYFTEESWDRKPFPLMTVREYVETFGGDITKKVLDKPEVILEDKKYWSPSLDSIRNLRSKLEYFEIDKSLLIECIDIENDEHPTLFSTTAIGNLEDPKRKHEILIKSKFWDEPTPFQLTFFLQDFEINEIQRTLTLELDHVNMPTLSFEKLPDGSEIGTFQKLKIEFPARSELEYQSKLEIEFDNGKILNFSNCESRLTIKKTNEQ